MPLGETQGKQGSKRDGWQGGEGRGRRWAERWRGGLRPRGRETGRWPRGRGALCDSDRIGPAGGGKSRPGPGETGPQVPGAGRPVGKEQGSQGVEGRRSGKQDMMMGVWARKDRGLIPTLMGTTEGLKTGVCICGCET